MHDRNVVRSRKPFKFWWAATNALESGLAEARVITFAHLFRRYPIMQVDLLVHLRINQKTRRNAINFVRR